MAENNIERFMSNKDKVLRLMEMDRSGELNKYNSANTGKDYETYVSESTNRKNQAVNVNQEMVNRANKKSKLPAAILESFQNDPIDGNVSVLDGINEKTQGKLFLNNNTPKQEPKRVVEQTQAQNSSVNIDYSMIKMIVEDCMRKQLSSIKKTIISEGIGNQNNNLGELKAMKIGNKFSFITENGDVYEAKLKFIKNIKSGEN